MGKLLIFILAMFCGTAHAAQIVNVEYIHELIKQRHGIDIQYNPALSSRKMAANMKYLLTAVDVANEMLNNKATTDYANSEYATHQAVDTAATITAVDTLIRRVVDPIFCWTPASTSTSYQFNISASGDFEIDWGDGKVEPISKADTTNTKYTHTYATPANENVICLTGMATGYASSDTTPTIGFSSSSAAYISAMDGCLGCIFPTLADESQPSFKGTFSKNSNLTGTIPSKLFYGITGQPRARMFCETFNGTGISGPIPADLFAGLNGAPTVYLFQKTFNNCPNLSGEIPGELFRGIKGAPQAYSFDNTFSLSPNLTGEIPGELFAGISGAPAQRMFQNTFNKCSGLTGTIPSGLFAGISGAPATNMFYGTFSECTGLTGIGENLFGSLDGAPAQYMFAHTFYKCTGLTAIPESLFGNIYGEYASSAFLNTFNGCTNLTGQSAYINGQHLYDIWTLSIGNATYRGATGLSDYTDIPDKWK